MTTFLATLLLAAFAARAFYRAARVAAAREASRVDAMNAVDFWLWETQMSTESEEL